jgi:hypothetical protein
VLFLEQAAELIIIPYHLPAHGGQIVVATGFEFGDKVLARSFRMALPEGEALAYMHDFLEKELMPEASSSCDMWDRGCRQFQRDRQTNRQTLPVRISCCRNVPVDASGVTGML